MEISSDDDDTTQVKKEKNVAYNVGMQTRMFAQSAPIKHKKLTATEIVTSALRRGPNMKVRNIKCFLSCCCTHTCKCQT